MFIFTAKFNKKKAVLAVLILAAVLIAVILIAGSISRSSNAKNAKETAALSAVVKNNDQRVKYLNSLGWEVDKNPLEEQQVVIPREFSDVYTKYNEIQTQQGFDLSKYGGIEAKRYTYKVLNYPETTGNVVADIIVYRNEVIAGDVQSNALDGFMVGLRYPKGLPSSPAPSAALPTAGNQGAVPSAQPNAGNQGTAPTAQPNAGNQGTAPTAQPNTGNQGTAPTAQPNAGNQGAAPTVQPNAGNQGTNPNNAANPNNANTSALTSDASALEELEP
ncbi:DUF4830 domain-containing protein [Sporobacter termitidis]|nr:DUF4830 domain-containing protein [Sporobacter termitidis]